MEDYIAKLKRRKGDYKEIYPSCLNWRPYVPPPTTEESQERNKAASEKKGN